MLDTATIRPQFPILETSVHGKPLIYLDNAATTQKPLAVLDAIRRCQPDTLTPIEAMSLLYELKQKLSK